MWSVETELQTGEVQIVARAWDSTAALQPERAESLWNPKGYVNNSWPHVTALVVVGSSA